MKYSEFTVKGCYYKKDKAICRKVLHISKDKMSSEPDLLVIMMNPGASHPADVNSYKEIKDNHLGKLVEAIPDKTQEKIMALMNNKSYNHSCILNLTDICNQDSKKLKSDSKHFSNFNKTDEVSSTIDKFAPNAKTVIIAWGCKTIFKDLIENVKRILVAKKAKVYGFPQASDKEGLYYYHPLVRSKDWLEKMDKIDL